MRPRNISQVLFSLVCLHLLVFSLIKCQESQTLEETKSLDIMDVSSSQPQEFHIIPGVTRRLSIKLQREGQEITLDFRPSVADVAMFDIQVFSNEKIESSHSITFNEPETLLLHVDELNGECIITGDKDFYMRVEIPKASYTVQISHERNLKNLTQNQNPNVHKDIGNSYLVIGICTAAGAGAIILLALKRFIAKRKKGDSFSLDKNVKNSEDWKRMISDRNFTEVDLDKAEHEEKNETEREREVVACSFNHVKPQIPKVPIKVPTVKTPGFSKKSPGLRDEKILRHKLAVDPRSKKSFLQKNSSKAKTQQNIEAKSDPEDVPIKEYKLSLQVYLDEEKEDRRNPTHKQIKALIRKMEEEGTLAQDCDPSAESDNEDQYEAPVLPNYFCCMLCFEGKRSAMVNPCRHIFSCKNCIDGLMDSYKICVLCSNEITGYEDLQN